MRQLRRSQIEIFFDILAILRKSPQRITRIMYATNINCNIIGRMLRIMNNAGYVSIPQRRIPHPLSKKKETKPPSKSSVSYDRIYTLTPEGLKFYERIAPAMEELKVLFNIIDAQSYAEEAQRYSNELDLRLAMQ